MKTKKVNQALFILSGLIILSFAFFVMAQNNSSGAENIFLDSDQDGLTDKEEKTLGTDPNNIDSDQDGYSDGSEVESGYDPLRPAPGDRVTEDSRVMGIEAGSGDYGENEKRNLTDELAQKIYGLSEKPEFDAQSVDLNDIKSVIDSSLDSQSIEEEIEQISLEDIKIKKQNYSNLSDKKAEERRKEDFTDYLVSVIYILTSNSPEPITSNNDINSVSNKLLGKILNALETQNPSDLEELGQNMERTFDQLIEVEAPEELVETHIKALKYVKYSQGLIKLINPNPDDPVSDLVNYSKLEAYLGNLAGFYEGIQEKIDQYNIEDSVIQEKIKGYGVDIDI